MLAALVAPGPRMEVIRLMGSPEAVKIEGTSLDRGCSANSVSFVLVATLVDFEGSPFDAALFFGALASSFFFGSFARDLDAALLSSSLEESLLFGEGDSLAREEDEERDLPRCFFEEEAVEETSFLRALAEEEDCLLEAVRSLDLVFDRGRLSLRARPLCEPRATAARREEGVGEWREEGEWLRALLPVGRKGDRCLLTVSVPPRRAGERRTSAAPGRR